MTVHTIANITPGGTATRIATSGAARWILFTVPAGNSGVIRVGDSSVSATQGAAVGAASTATSLLFPPLPVNHELRAADQLYDLSTIYAYGTSSDTVGITYGV